MCDQFFAVANNSLNSGHIKTSSNRELQCVCYIRKMINCQQSKGIDLVASIVCDGSTQLSSDVLVMEHGGKDILWNFQCLQTLALMIEITVHKVCRYLKIRHVAGVHK